MKFFRQVTFILRIEALFFIRFPRLLAATLVVASIPALYAAIYLASVWDPASKTSALQVALVNLDQGVNYRGKIFNAGNEVVSNLRQRQTFGFVDFQDETLARHLVAQGQLAFALVIPKDFSSNAVPGHEEGAGKLVVYLSEGNNFESAMLAKEFARELGHDVNEHLNERRWQLVLLGAAGSQRSVDTLRQSVDQLHNGAHELSQGLNALANGTQQSASGAQRLYSGVDQLTDGVKQLGAGLRTMEAKHPRPAELDRLKSGAEQLAAGQAEMGRGMKELQSGSQRVRAGVAAFREEAHGNMLVPSRVSDGMDALFDGVVQLDTGLQTAGEAQLRLDDGASKLNAGVGALTSGVRAISSGLHTMLSKMPEDSQLDELDNGASNLSSGLNTLNQGSHKAHAGAERLAAGLHLLAAALPATVDQPEGSAQGLAQSVKPVLEVVAAVPNSGSAFAPNVIPAALWLGAGIAAFLFHVRVLPKHAMQFSRPAQFTGKVLIPMLLVLIQAGLLYLTATVVLHIHVVHPALFALALALTALAFLGIVFALTRAFGDAGKALSMILLAVQLSSSGAIIPVELSGGLFSDISPWLPLTWVVRAMKATMFDAYAGAWLQPMLVIALTGLLSLCCACWVGHWRFVQPAQVRPAVDF